MLKSLDCSVIQGSKMSGLLYTIYTNEIPLLHKIMNTYLFTKLTGKPQINTNNKITHDTINFVDDSTNIISTTEIPLMQDYINSFYLLLESVYNVNKLVINKDKTELMVVCKDMFCQCTKNFLNESQ